MTNYAWLVLMVVSVGAILYVATKEKRTEQLANWNSPERQYERQKMERIR